MIHTLNRHQLHTESFSVTQESQRMVLARQLRRERQRGFIVSPIVRHKSFAVVAKGTLQAIKRIDLDSRLCYGAGRKQIAAAVTVQSSTIKPYTIS